jgi:hypothetical protein
MPLQNRVMPDGGIVAIPLRGILTGNRGILHRGDRTLGRARWRHRAWISCRLDWKGLRRVPMSDGTWTELFFHDEAVALAAGHRPCALCRREAYRAFQGAWRAAGLGEGAAPEMDRVLHAARTARGPDGATHRARAEDLPDGTMILHRGGASLLLDGNAVAFDETGYGPAAPRPSGEVGVLTPAPMLAVLRAGYRPALHPSLRKG